MKTTGSSTSLSVSGALGSYRVLRVLRAIETLPPLTFDWHVSLHLKLVQL
jgi:hypothetical protein